MSKVKSVTVSVGQKISHNYNSFSMDLSLQADISDDEQWDQEVSNLYSQIEEKLATEYKKWAGG